MAVAYDNSTNSGAQAASSSHTFSHTCSGSERFLVVFVGMSDTVDADRDVISITYGGQAMTYFADDGDNTANIDVFGYYLANPASGANNVAITLDNANDNWGAIAISFTGADFTRGIFTTSGVLAATSSSLNLGAAANALVVDCTVTNVTATTPSAGANQTNRNQFDYGGTRYLQVSTEPSASPSSTTMSWDTSPDGPGWGHIVLEVNQSSILPNVSDSITVTEAKNVALVHNPSNENSYIQGVKILGG